MKENNNVEHVEICYTYHTRFRRLSHSNNWRDQYLSGLPAYLWSAKRIGENLKCRAVEISCITIFTDCIVTYNPRQPSFCGLGVCFLDVVCESPWLCSVGYLSTPQSDTKNQPDIDNELLILVFCLPFTLTLRSTVLKSGC